MRIPSLLLCSAKNAKSVQVVLRGRCSSVDEPIQGSTPALVIPDSLTTPTPKHSLTICSICSICTLVPAIREAAGFRNNLSLVYYRQIELNRTPQNDCFKSVMRQISKQHH